MKFEHTSVTNMEGALRGMRNPMNSWSKSDSIFGVELDYQEHEDGSRHVTKCHEICNIGEQDLKLAQRLILAGPEHRKFMRQIFVCVDITAPIFWWKEADQTKVGTVTDSCSTMHKIMESEFTPDMFACEEMRGYKCIVENRPNEIDEDTELWKEYPGDSNYLVSNQGRVKHLSYTNTNGRTMKERILCGSVHNDGYIVISLCLGGSK